MRMPAHLTSLVTTLALCSAAAAIGRPEPGTAEISDIEWTVQGSQKQNGVPTLQIRHSRKGFNSSFSIDTAEPELAKVRTALGAAAGGSVAFTISREPGVLACRGVLWERDRGGGECRFTGRSSFIAALRQRGLELERDADLLAMTLFDADLALIDGLSRQGLAPLSVGDIIGAAALGVTPAYVASLQSAGLKLASIEDVIACRALGIDDAYVRGIAAAGYRLDAQQIVAMKATGITPDYAEKMNRAARREREKE